MDRNPKPLRDRITVQLEGRLRPRYRHQFTQLLLNSYFQHQPASRGVSAVEFNKTGEYVASATKAGCLSVHNFDTMYCSVYANSYSTSTAQYVGQPVVHINTKQELDALRWNLFNRNEVAVPQGDVKKSLFLTSTVVLINLLNLLASSLTDGIYMWDLRAKASPCLRFFTETSPCSLNSLDVDKDDRVPLNSMNLSSLLREIEGVKEMANMSPWEIHSIKFDPSTPYQLAFHLENSWSGVINVYDTSLTHVHSSSHWMTINEFGLTMRRPAWLPTLSVYATPVQTSSLKYHLYLVDFYPEKTSPNHIYFKLTQNKYIWTSEEVLCCAVHPFYGTIVAGGEDNSLLMVSQKTTDSVRNWQEVYDSDEESANDINNQVNRKVFEASAGKLRVVGHAVVGIGNVDLAAATEHGCLVVNAPTANTMAAAEHSIALMAGKWQRNKYVGVSLVGKTLAILGFGKVGTEVARRAKGLGIHVVAYDPYASAARAHAIGVDLVSFDDALSTADFISLHMPLIDSTNKMLNDEPFAKKKKGIRIINVVRGGVIDEEALVRALDSGIVAQAALDVFTQEPPPTDSKLVLHENVTDTPHLGASTVEAQEEVAIEIAEAVVGALKGELSATAVNAPMVSAEVLSELAPYVELSEKLARLAVQLVAGGGGVKSVKVTYASAQTPDDLDTRVLRAMIIKGLIEPISGVFVNLVNAYFAAKQRGIRIIEERVQTDDTS